MQTLPRMVRRFRPVSVKACLPSASERVRPPGNNISVCFMKTLGSAWLFLLLAATLARAASLAIDSLAGPVTANEVNSFITYMQSQTPPP